MEDDKSCELFGRKAQSLGDCSASQEDCNAGRWRVQRSQARPETRESKYVLHANWGPCCERAPSSGKTPDAGGSWLQPRHVLSVSSLAPQTFHVRLENHSWLSSANHTDVRQILVVDRLASPKKHPQPPQVFSLNRQSGLQLLICAPATSSKSQAEETPSIV